jgi:mycothiol synthase
VEGTTTRKYEAADAAAVAELWNLIAAHAGGHPGETAETVAAYVAASVRDHAADTRLVFADTGELVAAAIVSAPPAAGTLVNLGGGVHPKWRRQGLGRGLLSWQLARAAEIHRSVAPDQPWEVHLDIVLADEDAVRLFRRFGLAPAHYWFDMVAPTALATTAAGDGRLPEGLRVETYRAEREAAVHAVHMTVFAGHWGFQYRELDRWGSMTVRGDDFLPELSLLAYDGDEIVGYVLSYRDPDPDRIYIGQVGVRQDWRRRGVAGGLLARVLRLAADAGTARAWLAVDADSPVGAVGVYERAGFTVESRAVTYTAALSTT